MILDHPLTGSRAELAPDELERYSRNLAVPALGLAGQERLKAARVAVIGAGGLGSPVLLYLAAAGVGSIGVVDGDAVEPSNLQRQIIHLTSRVGDRKAASAAEVLRSVNPGVTVVAHDCRLTPDNGADLVGEYDLVVDASDNFPTRYLVSDIASDLGVPHVWGSVFRLEGYVSVFWSKYGFTYRDLYPQSPPEDVALRCAQGGVLGALCGMVGSTMALEAMKIITGMGDVLIGRVKAIDGMTQRWVEYPLIVEPGASALD